jgi:hypothetical protein
MTQAKRNERRDRRAGSDEALIVHTLRRRVKKNFVALTECYTNLQ